MPTATALSGISCVTTALAPITTLSPILTLPIILAHANRSTLLPIIDAPLPYILAIVTF